MRLYLGRHQLRPGSKLFFEHMIRVLGEEEGYFCMSLAGTLQGLAISLPVDLEVLLPDDHQYQLTGQ